MRVERVDVTLCDVPSERSRSDAIQSFTKQETIVVDVHTESGLSGTGYSYTIGTGGAAIAALIRNDLVPLIVGSDTRMVEKLWHRMWWGTHATAIGAITSCAIAAIDIALWDLRCKSLGQPLHLLAGGARDRVPMYDTEGGWLNIPTEDLVDLALTSKERGWPGVKIKVGKPDAREDFERVHSVRTAIGPDMHIMVDANQSLTYPEARRRAQLFEALDIFWFEEPLHSDDVTGHATLAASTSIPIAVGESLYSLGQFREYLCAGAAGIIQPDVARVGGITPWLKAAHLAEAFNIHVAPHFLMELHVGLGAAVSNVLYVEHLPQLRALTASEVNVEGGCGIASSAPGIGIQWNRTAIERLSIPLDPMGDQR